MKCIFEAHNRQYIVYKRKLSPISDEMIIQMIIVNHADQVSSITDDYI